MKTTMRDAVGETIRCPECGRPATVAHAQSRVRPTALQSAPILTAMSWCSVACECRGPGGRKLYRDTMPVEMIEEAQPWQP